MTGEARGDRFRRRFKCFVHRPQQDSTGILRLDGTKWRIEFFEQFKITLLRPTMFAVIHSVERLDGLAEVTAIVASYGSQLHLYALRDPVSKVDLRLSA